MINPRTAGILARVVRQDDNKPQNSVPPHEGCHPASTLQRNRLSAAARFRRRGNDLARISHTIFARSSKVERGFVSFCGDVLARGVGRRERELGFFRSCGCSEQFDLSVAWDDAVIVTGHGGACHAGEPRALAAALRRVAARPQTAATGHSLRPSQI